MAIARPFEEDVKTYSNGIKKVSNDAPELTEREALKLDAVKLRRSANDFSVRLARFLGVKACEKCGKKM